MTRPLSPGCEDCKCFSFWGHLVLGLKPPSAPGTLPRKPRGLCLPLAHPLQPHSPPRRSPHTPRSPALGPPSSPLSNPEPPPGSPPSARCSGLCSHLLREAPDSPSLPRTSEALVSSTFPLRVPPCETTSTCELATATSPALSPGPGTQQSSAPGCRVAELSH